MQNGVGNIKSIMQDKTEKQYRISAVIPVYNREKTIKRCIDSIMAQTYSVFEIIVVDDGSTDRTLDVIKREFDNAVIIIRQNHKGAQAARNAGIKAARGEYIAFLDSDDEWLPKTIELQVQELHKNADIVVCGNGYVQMDWENGVPSVYRSVGTLKKNFKPGARKLLRMNGQCGDVYKSILRSSFCLFGPTLVSKKSLLDIGMLDEKAPAFQEWDMAIRLAMKKQFVFITKPLFVYHLHDGETISKSPKKDIDGSEYICEKYKYEIMSKLGNEELTRRYKELLKKCITYRDRRAIIYFFKYVAGKMHIFILS